LFYIPIRRPHPNYTLFPTRRSSDLMRQAIAAQKSATIATAQSGTRPSDPVGAAKYDISVLEAAVEAFEIDNGRYPTTEEGLGVRSEEHTSELQSQSNLVCRLRLEKK